MERLNQEEINKRDKNALCYYYYKPVFRAEYKGQQVKRKHYCEKCDTEGSLTPYYFWSGRGCQNCSNKRGQGQQFSDEKVMQRDINALCSSSYLPDPDQPYINQYQKRRHTCLDCGHQGEVAIKSYWNGSGCPVCGVKKGSENKIKNAGANAVKKDKGAKAYDTYPPISEYKGGSIHRLHQCKVCNHLGKVTPDNFWHNGRGCPKCGIKLGSGNKRRNMKEIAPDRDRESKYYASYSPVSEYTGAFEHRIHRCSVCGHEGKMTPNNFWRGRGCPVCADSGFDKTASAILYYLRIAMGQGRYLYKIGITNRTVKSRYNNTDLSLIGVVKEWFFEKGGDAYKSEQEIIKKYSEFLYAGESILGSGNSEIFVNDILKLDGQI